MKLQIDSVFLCVGMATDDNIIPGTPWKETSGHLYSVKQSESPSTLYTYWGGAGSDKYKQ